MLKKCPFCAEEIQDEAIVCRWCGRDLPGSHFHTVVESSQDPDEEPNQISARETHTYSSGKIGLWGGLLVACSIGLSNYFLGLAGEPLDTTIKIITNWLIYGLVITGIVSLFRRGERGKGALIIGLMALLFSGLYFVNSNLQLKLLNPFPGQNSITQLTSIPQVSPSIVSQDEAIKVTSTGSFLILSEIAKLVKDEGKTYYYNVSLTPNSKPVILDWDWCAKTMEELDSNMNDFEFKILINKNETPLTSTLERTYDETIWIDGRGNQPAKCRDVAILLSDWPIGVHELIISGKTKHLIFDGWDSFQTGYTITEIYYVIVR